MNLRDLILLPAIGMLVVTGVLLDPAFLSSDNLTNLLRQQSELALLVLAASVILIGGRIDLSLESTVGLAAVLVIPAFGVGLPSWAAIPLCLLAGVLVGAFNALLVLQFRLSAFVATLGTLIVLRGLQTGLTGGGDVTGLPQQLRYLGAARWLGLPASLWIAAVLFLAGIAFLGWFRHGRAVYAIGGNLDAARAAGIRTDPVLWTAIVSASVLAALAGLLMAGRLGSIAATQGQGMTFIVLAAAIVGGVSLNGGKGSLIGALCGVLGLGLVDKVLRLAGIAAHWIPAIYGTIVIAALVLARMSSGRAHEPPSAVVP